MLNMLRMDFYRLIRSKSLYICLGLLAAASVLCYWMIWLVVTPQGQAAAESLGMTAYLYTAEDFGPQILQQYDTLDMLREICMDGGAYTCILGIFTAIFVYMDFHSGFLKNTLSLHRNRWKYICSKTLLAALVNLCILLLLLGLCLLLNLFFGGMLPLAGPGETLFYLSWAWLNTTAFLTLVIFISSFTRSSAAGIVVTLLLSSGLAVTLVAQFTGLFGANEWIKYTLYYNLSYGPSLYTGPGDLKTYAISLVFLTVYSVAAAVALSKRDI